MTNLTIYFSDFSGNSKIVAYNKSGKNTEVTQPLNFSKLLSVENSKFLLTFNKQSIFVFDSRNLENVDNFHRRFGEIRDVCVDNSNIYIRGSIDTVSKYKLSTEIVDNGFDEADFISTVKHFFFDSYSNLQTTLTK